VCGGLLVLLCCLQIFDLYTNLCLKWTSFQNRINVDFEMCVRACVRAYVLMRIQVRM
jgi:hypothetical protein